MRFPVRPELTTASAVHGLCIDHDRRYGQLCTVLNPPHRTYLSGYVCSDQPSHFCRGLTSEQQCAVLDYIAENFEALDRVSFRTATKLAELIRLEPDHWHSMASIGILNSVDHSGGN
jgi:hypothetical protein